MRIGTGRGDQQDIESFPKSLFVRGGDVQSLRIDEELVAYRRNRGPKPFIQGSTWEAICGVSLTYECAGQKLSTPWFNLVANFLGPDVDDVKPYPWA